MWPWHMYGWGWGSALIVTALMLFILGVLIALVVVTVRSQSRTGRSDNSDVRDRTALEILKERYARGEITRQEYQSMRREIETT